MTDVADETWIDEDGTLTGGILLKRRRRCDGVYDVVLDADACPGCEVSGSIATCDGDEERCASQP